MIKKCLKSLLVYLLILCGSLTPVFADDDDDEKGGKGQMRMNESMTKMDLIVNKNKVLLRIIAPSQLVVGTELKPESAREKSKYSKYVEELGKLNNVVEFTDSAKCILVSFKEKSEDLMESLHNGPAKPSNKSFDEMMDKNMNNANYINTTLLYEVICKKPSRLATMKPTIFELYDDLDIVYFRWRNNGSVGQQKITAQDELVYLYNRPGQKNNMQDKDDDDDD